MKLHNLHSEELEYLQTKKLPISYAFYLNQEQRDVPNTKNFRKYYKGRMTKRYFRILLRNSNSEPPDVVSSKYIDIMKTIKQKTEVNLITSVFKNRVANATICLLI